MAPEYSPLDDLEDPTHIDTSERIPLDFLIFYLRYKNREYNLCIKFLVYLPFLAFLTWSLLGGKGLLGPGFWTTDAFRDVAAEGEWNQGPDNDDLYFMKTWMDIGEDSDFYRWMLADEAFQTFLNQPENYVVNGLSKLVTPIRVAQWRSQPKECSQLRDYLGGREPTEPEWRTCWHKYTSREDKEDMNTNLDVCGRDFPLGNIGVSGFRFYDSHRDDPVISEYPGVQTSQLATTLYGEVERYKVNENYPWDIWPNGLGTYLEGPGNAAEHQLRTNEKIECMSEQGWIDEGTRAVMVAFFGYNPSENLFIRVMLLLEIPQAGRYLPSAYYDIFNVEAFSGGWTIFREVVLILYLCWFFFVYVWELKKVCPKFGHWLSQFWTWVNGVIIGLLAWLTVWKIVFWTFPAMQLDAMDLPELDNLPEFQRPVYLQEVNFERLMNYAQNARTINTLGGFVALAAYIKIFQFVGLRPHFNLLTETTRRSAGPLAAVMASLGIIMAGLVIQSMLLYGHALREFYSFGRAFVTLIRVSLGDFDYRAMDGVTHEFTPAFFGIFTVIVWLIVLNMFIGVISEAFSTAKAKREKAILTVKSWVLQQSFFSKGREFAKKSEFVSKRASYRELKTKSPIRFNRLNGVGVGTVMRVLLSLQAKYNEVPTGFAGITREEFAAEWKVHQATRHLTGNKSGLAISEALWDLMGSTRESIHTLAALYEDDLEATLQDINGPPILRQISPDIKLQKLWTANILLKSVNLNISSTMVKVACCLGDKQQSSKQIATSGIVGNPLPLNCRAVITWERPLEGNDELKFFIVDGDNVIGYGRVDMRLLDLDKTERKQVRVRTSALDEAVEEQDKDKEANAAIAHYNIAVDGVGGNNMGSGGTNGSLSRTTAYGNIITPENQPPNYTPDQCVCLWDPCGVQCVGSLDVTILHCPVVGKTLTVEQQMSVMRSEMSNTRDELRELTQTVHGLAQLMNSYVHSVRIGNHSPSQYSSAHDHKDLYEGIVDHNGTVFQSTGQNHDHHKNIVGAARNLAMAFHTHKPKRRFSRSGDGPLSPPNMPTMEAHPQTSATPIGHFANGTLYVHPSPIVSPHSHGTHGLPPAPTPTTGTQVSPSYWDSDNTSQGVPSTLLPYYLQP